MSHELTDLAMAGIAILIFAAIFTGVTVCRELIRHPKAEVLLPAQVMANIRAMAAKPVEMSDVKFQITNVRWPINY